MLRIKLYDLEYEIEDVKLSYEIMKLTDNKYDHFGLSKNFYVENNILDLTDDLSNIANNLKIDGTNILRVNYKIIGFSSADKILCDVIEKIMERGKKCDVIELSSTQNDKKLYFYNYFFSDMIKDYHSNLFKYQFHFAYFYFKQ